MTNARERVELRVDSPTTVFKLCDWPPPPYAFEDGYSEIAITEMAGPGEGPVSGTNLAHVVTPSERCTQVELRYTVGRMGFFEHLRPLVVRPGDLVHPTLGSLTPTGEPLEELPLPFIPQSSEAVVILSDNFHLDSARCI